MKARTRITVLVVGLSLAASSMAAGITVLIMQRQSYAFLDAFLRQEAKEAAESWQKEGSGGKIFRHHRQGRMQEYRLRLVDPATGKLFYSAGEDIPLHLLPPSGKTKTVRGGRCKEHYHGTNHRDGHHVFRLANFTFTSGNRPLQVVIGRSLPDYDHLSAGFISLSVWFFWQDFLC